MDVKDYDLFHRVMEWEGTVKMKMEHNTDQLLGLTWGDTGTELCVVRLKVTKVQDESCAVPHASDVWRGIYEVLEWSEKCVTNSFGLTTKTDSDKQVVEGYGNTEKEELISLKGRTGDADLTIWRHSPDTNFKREPAIEIHCYDSTKSYQAAPGHLFPIQPSANAELRGNFEHVSNLMGKWTDNYEWQLKPVAKPTRDITAVQLCAIMPQVPRARLEDYTAMINTIMNEFDIVTLERQSAFLGQLAVESLELNKFTEGLYHKEVTTLRAAYKIFREMSDADAEPYTKHPEKLANYVYANRNGNGNEASGDGWRYRGLGAIQLTGKTAYTAAARDLGVKLEDLLDLVNDPKEAARSLLSFKIAGWYWQNRKINSVADTFDLDAVTVLVNGSAKLHLDKRIEFSRKAYKTLCYGPK